MENPLLLEQYEAQIFSIIRQNISIKNSDPEVIIKNYKLIQLFLTIPLSKDESIAMKIITMLTEQLSNK
jgi:hypothetical protein